LWDVAEQALYFTDVLAKKIRRYHPQTDSFSAWNTPNSVSSLALNAGGGALLALSNGIHAFDFASGAATLIVDPEIDKPLTILNDGKTDRRGRFVVGSVATDHTSPICGLYKIECGVATCLDDGFTITNGPCWSPDGRTFYFADSVPHAAIYAYDYDLDRGTVANKRVFARTRELGGFPDGATVDTEGRVWTAVCGAGKIACYESNGSLAQIVEVPPRLVSSVMFGGAGLDELYVTSIDAAALAFGAGAPDEAGGNLFVISDLGARGIAEPRCDGST
jgi:sugar lactone lactonase YvrE